MNKILSVATAGLFTEQLNDVNHQRFPRVDYLELQRLLNTETLDYSAYNRGALGKVFRRLETQLRSDVYLATLSWLKSCQYPLVFAWSERAGIPLAGYRRLMGSMHRLVAMFQCWSARQELAVTKLDLFSAMDEIIVHCSSMKRHFVSLGAPADKISIVHYSIDQNFFSPIPDGIQRKNFIMSVGESRSRDYASLFQAVEGLPVDVKVAAFGHWYAREKYQSIPVQIPQNVSLMSHLSQMKLRDMYGCSQFVVLPIRNLTHSAGATATLEAGSMSRAVIAFRSEGIADYIVDGETGLLVDVGDVDGLRQAIRHLLDNPDEAERLGRNARQRILRELSMESYVQNLATVLLRVP